MSSPGARWAGWAASPPSTSSRSAGSPSDSPGRRCAPSNGLPVSTRRGRPRRAVGARQHRTAFDAVAEHPSTVVALRDLYRELRLAGDRPPSTGWRRRRAAAATWRACLRLVADRLAPTWYDEGDLLTHAIADRRCRQLDPALTRVVVFLPQSLGPLEVDLRRARSATAGRCAVAARSHRRRAADRRSRGSRPPRCRRNPIAVAAASRAAAPPRSCRSPTPTRRSGTPSATVVDAARRRHAARPRSRPVADRSTVRPARRAPPRRWPASPGTGVRARKVSERLVPRFLLDLLDVDRRGLRRRDLFDLLADVPVRDRRRAAGLPSRPGSASAATPVSSRTTSGLRACGPYAASATASPPPTATATTSGDRSRRQSPQSRCRRRRVAGRRSSPSSATSSAAPARTRAWSEWADWAVAPDRTTGSARPRCSTLDEAEFQAWEHTTRVLDRLRHLDAVGESGDAQRVPSRVRRRVRRRTRPARADRRRCHDRVAGRVPSVSSPTR